MKTGVIIIIVVVLILGGIIAYSLMSKTDNTNSGNQNPSTNTQDSGNQNTATRDVQIQNFAFIPKDLTIKVGDTVTWTNNDNTLHAVTSDSGNELDSEDLDKGQTYSYKFTNAGNYEYHCNYHNSMKAKIIVG